MITSTGKAYRSNTWIRLWPRNATTIWTTTMISRQSTSGRWVREFSASVPLTLFTANQPIPPVTELIPAGRAFPQYPKPRRLSTICGTPKRGPWVDKRPWVMAPSPVPITMARTVDQKLRPKAPDAEEADEDRRELHVRRGPGPEELERAAVPLAERDELRSAGLYGDDLVAVAALSYLNVG